MLLISIHLDHADLCIFHYAVLYYAVLFVNQGVVGFFSLSDLYKNWPLLPPAALENVSSLGFVSLAQ